MSKRSIRKHRHERTTRVTTLTAVLQDIYPWAGLRVTVLPAIDIGTFTRPTPGDPAGPPA